MLLSTIISCSLAITAFAKNSLSYSYSETDSLSSSSITRSSWSSSSSSSVRYPTSITSGSSSSSSTITSIESDNDEEYKTSLGSITVISKPPPSWLKGILKKPGKIENTDVGEKRAEPVKKKVQFDENVKVISPTGDVYWTHLNNEMPSWMIKKARKRGGDFGNNMVEILKGELKKIYSRLEDATEDVKEDKRKLERLSIAARKCRHRYSNRVVKLRLDSDDKAKKIRVSTLKQKLPKLRKETKKDMKGAKSWYRSLKRRRNKYERCLRGYKRQI